MDIDTIIIIGLLVCAISWWLIIRVHEEREFIKECHRQEKDRLKRMERVKQLYNKV